MRGKRISWSVEFLPKQASPELMDLTITSEGDIFVASPHKEDSSLITLHRNLNSERWETEVVDPEPLSALFLDITTINEHLPAITYMDLDGIDLKLALREGPHNWRRIYLEVPQDVGGFPRAKPLSEDSLVITFYDYTSKQLKLGIYQSGKWNSVPILELDSIRHVDLEVIPPLVFVAVRTEGDVKLAVVDLSRRKLSIRRAGDWAKECLTFDFTPLPNNRTLAFSALTVRGNLILGTLDLGDEKLTVAKKLIFPNPMKFRGDISIKVFEDQVLMSCYAADTQDLIALKVPTVKIASSEPELKLSPEEVFTVDSIGDVGEKNKLQIAKIPIREQLPEENSSISIIYYYAFIAYSDSTNNRVKLARLPLKSVEQTPELNVEPNL